MTQGWEQITQRRFIGINNSSNEIAVIVCDRSLGRVRIVKQGNMQMTVLTRRL